MTPDAILSDCERLLMHGDIREAARRLEHFPTPLVGRLAERREKLLQSVQIDRHVFGIGAAVSLMVAVAALLSYA